MSDPPSPSTSSSSLDSNPLRIREDVPKDPEDPEDVPKDPEDVPKDPEDVPKDPEDVPKDPEDPEDVPKDVPENLPNDLPGPDSDDVLSEIDENQFDDYDPATAQIRDRPVAIDADAAQTLKATKRKRVDADAPKTARSRRLKRARRIEVEKTPINDGNNRPLSHTPITSNSSTSSHTDSPLANGHDDGSSKLRRRRAAAAQRSARKKAAPPAEPENEENLSPEERRSREITRALDAAAAKMVKPARRSKKEQMEFLEEQIDEEISRLKVRIEQACQADHELFKAGRPATRKIALLPDVAHFLSRTNAQDAILDPDINFLKHVRYLLEPLHNGTLPAYCVQHDLFAALLKLPVNKDTCKSSGVGGLALFYTRSKQPLTDVKRMAQRLVEEWTRPALNITCDWSKLEIETRLFDSDALKYSKNPSAYVYKRMATPEALAAARLAYILRPPNHGSTRSQLFLTPESYTIAPINTFDPSAPRRVDHRPIGAGAIEAFRRITQRNKKR